MIGLERAGNSKGTIKLSRSSHVHIFNAFYSCDHLSLRVVILVADQDPVDHLAVLVDLVQPALHVGEALAAGDVVDDDDAVRAAVVGAGDGAEALLARRVPDLQLHLLPMQLDCANLEVHP